MKLRFKPAWVGLFLIGIMLFSTFAYAVIQSLYPKQNAKLPETNIIGYYLDPDLRNALVQYGQTVITFEYNLGCNNCVDQKSALELLANEYKQQIWLEEIVDESLADSKITIASVYGEDKLVGGSGTELSSSLCKLMVEPPVSCALQKT